jgi:hypothetical protein
MTVSFIINEIVLRFGAPRYDPTSRVMGLKVPAVVPKNGTMVGRQGLSFESSQI